VHPHTRECEAYCGGSGWSAAEVDLHMKQVRELLERTAHGGSDWRRGAGAILVWKGRRQRLPRPAAFRRITS